MLITCKGCAAVNFVQCNRAKRGDLHCTICKKVLDLNAPTETEDQKPALMPVNAIGNLLADSVVRIPAAPMWGKNEDGDTSPDPLMLSELEKKIENMNSKQRLAIATLIEGDESYEKVDIEDEEEELLDMSPSIKLPAMDLARWNKVTMPSIPSTKRRQRLNQRLTLAAWIFVAGLGTAGVAGAAVASAAVASAPEKKTATAALAEIAPQQKLPTSAKTAR